MNFYVIVIIAICITLEGVRASPVGKSQESFDEVLKSQNNNKTEIINFEPDLHDSSLWRILKKVATWFGYTGEQSHTLRGELSPWPAAQVPYIIDDFFDDVYQRVIINAMTEFHKYTCVRFVPRENDDAFIRIIPSSIGCQSHVGYTGGSFDVHLESPGCGGNMGSVMHELMHVIGFVHEQSRHDRDDYVTIQWANIISGGEINFNRYENTDLNDQGVSYDFDSLMHYPDDAFSINGEKTIIPKVYTDSQLGQRNGFSRKDILKINRMYQCE